MGLGWTWHLGTVGGIPIRVHWSFGLLLLGVAWRSRPEAADWWLGTVYGLVLVLALFACVTLHELGHGVMARWHGIGVRDVTLLPFGGMTRLELRPGQVWPVSEVLIALAGPAVNLALALALAPLAWLAGGGGQVGPPALPWGPGHLSPAGLVTSLWLGNLLLAGFNLLPIFPMDGGRVLRAVLSLWGDRARATRTAVVVGLLLTLGLASVGLVTGSLLLVAIAVLLVLGAGRELATLATPRQAIR
jgi:Zn-dependent protease